MRASNRRTAVVLVAAALIGCERGTTTPTQDQPDNSQPTNAGTFTSPASGRCPALRPNSVLVDATHDGGVWWYPQSGTPPDGFAPDAEHQGRALAEYLRGRGYIVTELGRGATLPTDSMRTYATVIRAGYYYDEFLPGYSAGDLAAYKAYLDCSRTLVLLGEFLRDGQHDVLAASLGIPLTGMVAGTITVFTAHELTTGVNSVPFMTGSFLDAGSETGIQVLGRLPTGERVMGVLSKGNAKVFFIGDTNGMELVPQPLVQNLVAWGFR
jgi:hypothetical protein